MPKLECAGEGSVKMAFREQLKVLGRSQHCTGTDSSIASTLSVRDQEIKEGK